MVFSSHLFIFYFLPLVLGMYYVAPARWRSALLTLVSFVFYGWSNPPWLGLMILCIAINYAGGRLIASMGGAPCDKHAWQALPAHQPRSPRQKQVLALSVIVSLAMLGFFKYFNFTLENLGRLSALLGGGTDWVPELRILLPVGISFFTFQSMSYTIDVYRGEARALRSPVDFACYVSMFPQLVAGPIVRYQTVAEQLLNRVHSLEKFSRGIAFFCLGLSKKILLANPMGCIADGAFAASDPAWHDAWFGLFSYAFQIYFDFSAYSDMAVGMGLMVGFRFDRNFDSPYLADSITDFWRRWHVSLSTWLRDYLYIPLGGNRSGIRRTYVNLLLVMLLGGLWHGASWNFVVWGAIHGCMLAFERSQGRTSPYQRLPRPLRVAITFLVTCVAWVFFRAATLPEAMAYCASLLGLGGEAGAVALLGALLYAPYHVLLFALCCVLVWMAPQAWEMTRRITPGKAAFCLVLFALSVIVMWTQSANPFLYYQF